MAGSLSINSEREAEPLLAVAAGKAAEGDERVLSHGGSPLGGIVNMTKSLFGAGVLAMPHAFRQTGLVFGCVLYVAIALVVVGSNFLLLQVERSIKHTETSPPRKYHAVMTYAEVGGIVFGPWGRLMMEVTVILLEIMFAVGFVIVALNNLHELTSLTRLELAAIAAPTLMALSCFRWLANFWGVSMFGLVVYLGGVMGVACYHSIDTLSNHNATIDTGEDSSINGAVLFISTSLYSIEGICLVLPITNSLRHPDMHAERVIGTGVMLYCFLVVAYAGIAFAGGLGQCGNRTLADGCIITDALPDGPLTDMVRITLVAGLTVSHPLCIYPCAEMIEPRMQNGAEPITNWQRLAMKWTLVLTTIVLGYLIPSFSAFANFGGSLLLPLAAFIVPPALFIKANKHSYSGSNIAVLVACVLSLLLGAFMMVAGVTDSIKSLHSNTASSNTSTTRPSLAGQDLYAFGPV